ncbi:hypothetical protein [Saccharopolyspora sp. NPDC002376]
MSVTDTAAIARDTSGLAADDLEQVLFHLGSAVDRVQTTKIVAHLDAGRVLPAAELLAAIAVAKQRTVSREDRHVLRWTIEAGNGDLTNVRVLESQAVEAGPGGVHRR